MRKQLVLALFGILIYTAKEIRSHSRSKSELAGDVFIPNTDKYIHPAPAQIM